MSRPCARQAVWQLIARTGRASPVRSKSARSDTGPESPADYHVSFILRRRAGARNRLGHYSRLVGGERPFFSAFLFTQSDRRGNTGFMRDSLCRNLGLPDSKKDQASIGSAG